MMNIKEQIGILAKLQAIDKERQQIQSALDKVSQATTNLESNQAQLRAKFEKHKTALADMRKKYRDLESELSMNMPRIEKSKAHLRSVKNNKEYQSMLKEIDELKKMNSGIEDEMLECLEKMDTAEQELEEKTSAFAEQKVKFENEIAEINQEATSGRAKLEALEGQWMSISDTVAPQVMDTFKKVRNQTVGSTIVPVNDAICRGCNMNIPPQLYNDLQRHERLMFCPHCQRIIYVLDN